MDKITEMTMEQPIEQPIQQLVQQADVILANLHFVRADWFYAFIPMVLFLLLSYFNKQDDKNWLTVIDQKLLPFVLTKSRGKRRRYPLLLVIIAASLCITALAGPVYKKLPQPVFREQSSLVVLLDLSRSMNATDIKPSRLARAKLELLDILSLRKTGQTALVVYAADAFVVTPLTDDNATIANLVPSLATEMMPAQGSNLSIALAKTNELFIQAGINKGDILLITDDIHKREQKAIEKIVSQGHRLSIFGIGTADGAPIPLDESFGGGFLLDSDGAIVIPRLDSNKLQRMALSGGGLYTVIDAGDSDVNKLARLFESRELEKDPNEDSDEDVNNNLTADVWQEEGHWLLLPLLFFAALWARRGWLSIIILFVLPLPQPAYAESSAESRAGSVKEDNPGLIDTNHLWSTPDQKAMKAFDSGDNNNAAQQFTDPDWKASAQYRNGDYQSVVDTLKDTDHSDGFYNKGNALANLGRYDEAIKAYDKAIELDPNNTDAAHNREQVKQAQQDQNQEQQNQQQDQNQEQPDQQEQNNQQQQSQDQDSQDQESQDSQQQDQQDQDQHGGESQQDAEQEGQKQDEQTQGEQQPDTEQRQQMEDESLKQRDAEAENEQEQQEQLEYQKQQEQQSDEAEEEQTSDREEQNKQQVEQADSDQKPLELEVNPTEASITEEEKATEQWLKRIPDDPGGLLRRKFLYQYNQTQTQQDDDQPW